MLDMGFEPEVRAILSQTSSGLYLLLYLPIHMHVSFVVCGLNSYVWARWQGMRSFYVVLLHYHGITSLYVLIFLYAKYFRL